MKAKTKNKDQPTKNHKKITEKENTIKKAKAMGNIAPNMDYFTEMDRREILLHNLICHANPDNG